MAYLHIPVMILLTLNILFFVLASWSLVFGIWASSVDNRYIRLQLPLFQADLKLSSFDGLDVVIWFNRNHNFCDTLQVIFCPPPYYTQMTNRIILERSLSLNSPLLGYDILYAQLFIQSIILCIIWFFKSFDCLFDRFIVWLFDYLIV